MVLGIVVDLSVLPYLLRPFPGPHRTGVPGRLVPVGSDCASRRRAVSRGSVHPRSETGVRVGSGVWPGLPVGEAVRGRAGVGSEHCSSLVRPSGRRGGPKSKAGVVPSRPGLPVGDWIALLACRLGIWASPGVARRLQRCLLGRAFVGKPVHEGPWVHKPARSLRAIWVESTRGFLS